MSDSVSFRVTVPGIHRLRNGDTQRVVWVGYKGAEIFAIGYDEDRELTDWNENGLWRYDLEGCQSDYDLVELIQADEPYVPTQKAAQRPIELLCAEAASALLRAHNYCLSDAQRTLSMIFNLSRAVNPQD